jgi:hypothetical protein
VIEWIVIYQNVKLMFGLELAMKVERGIEERLYSFFNLGASWG